MSDWIYLGDTTPFPTDIGTLVLSLLVAFLAGQLLVCTLVVAAAIALYRRTWDTLRESAVYGNDAHKVISAARRALNTR